LIIKRVLGLKEANVFADEGKLVYSFADDLYKCDGGFYSAHQIFGTSREEALWPIILFILIAIIFTVVFNAYYPILFRMYSQLKELVASLQDNKEDSEMKSMQAHIIAAKVSAATMPNAPALTWDEIEERSMKLKEEERKRKDKRSKRKEYCVYLWTAFSVFCTLMAALVIAAGAIALLQVNK
jgi:ABC-type sugar transport system permease subunit